MSHEFELERTALYALGTLPEREIGEAEAHLVSCAICLDEYAELRDTASSVALAAEVASDEHEFRLKRTKQKLSLAVQRQPQLARSLASNYDGWYRAAAAAAIILAVGTSSWSISLGKRLSSAQTALVRSEQRRREAVDAASHAQSRLAVLLAPDSQRYEVASGLIVKHAGRVYLAMSKLPQLPAKHVFQAWTLAAGATAVAPSITFSADAGGSAFVELPQNVAAAKAIALSVEPRGGSAQPTTKPLFIQSIT